MGKLQKFDIIFDNPKGFFFAGQAVRGKVLIILTAPMKITGVSIKFNGQARVSWTEMKTMQQRDYEERHQMVNRDSSYDSYSASESYFDHNIQLEGLSKSDTLLQGETSLPFSFKLPIGIPSSFEGSFGYIRYFCRAKIHYRWKFASVCKMPFSVVSFLDLNQQPKAKEPITREKHKTFCCLCCASGKLSFVVRIDRTGYVPGESIAINAEIDNLSKKDIDSSSVVLQEKITYRAEGRTNSEKKKIAEIKHGPVPARQSDEWIEELMPIPFLPPSFLGCCKIIDIEYYVVFSVQPSGLCCNLSVTMPILIGTIPLHNNFANFQSPTLALPNILTMKNYRF